MDSCNLFASKMEVHSIFTFKEYNSNATTTWESPQCSALFVCQVYMYVAIDVFEVCMKQTKVCNKILQNLTVVTCTCYNKAQIYFLTLLH